MTDYWITAEGNSAKLLWDRYGGPRPGVVLADCRSVGRGPNGYYVAEGFVTAEFVKEHLITDAVFGRGPHGGVTVRPVQAGDAVTTTYRRAYVVSGAVRVETRPAPGYSWAAHP